MASIACPKCGVPTKQDDKGKIANHINPKGRFCNGT